MCQIGEEIIYESIPPRTSIAAEEQNIRLCEDGAVSDHWAIRCATPTCYMFLLCSRFQWLPLRVVFRSINRLRLFFGPRSFPPLLIWQLTNIHRHQRKGKPFRTTCYSKALFGGYHCLVVILRFFAPLRFSLTVIVVAVIVLHLLPLSPLNTAYSFIKEKAPNPTGIWLDVTASRRECPSHGLPIIRPSRVICDLFPVLKMTESSCQDSDGQSTWLTSMFSRKPSPITLTRRQRPFTPSAHASSPSC